MGNLFDFSEMIKKERRFQAITMVRKISDKSSPEH